MAENTYSTFIQQVVNQGVYRGANVIQYADGGGELYISFQVLLKFLDEYVSIQRKDNPDSIGTPLLKIDWESDKPFFAFSTSVSFNLKKCYLYNAYVGTSDGIIYQDGVFTFHPFTYFHTEPNGWTSTVDLELNKKILQLQIPPTGAEKYSVYPTVGNINYIYLNVDYLSTLITAGSDNPENGLNIRQFLQDICDGVGKALGSLNDFQVIVDEFEGKLTVVDFNQKRIKGLTTIVPQNKVTTLKAQGLGSFVTNLSAQSSITPDIATAIAIGAQANANRLGQEATTFSRLSKGFTDSFYPEKDIGKAGDMTKALDTSTTSAQSFENSRKTYIDIINNQIEVGGKEIVTLKSQDNLNLENICVDFYKALLGKFTEEQYTATTFIPIKLNLSLKGISGIKIFQRFTLTGDVLPLTYRDNYDFIITGVSHEVNNSGAWITTLSAIITLKDTL